MKKITENCSVCTACVSKCPKSAISISKKIYNEIKVNNQCIDCNICKDNCPGNKEKKKNSPIFKVARIKSPVNINKSTSGGLFGEIARYVLKHSGVVYGAAFSDNFHSVKHIRSTNSVDLNKILKSKYVRSNINNSYLLAEKDLKKGKIVLFSGTPCQIAGLKCFLKKDYSNLITIDIICHGTPSEKIWSKYLTSLETKFQSKAKYVDFRYYNENDPTKCFLVEFKNGKVYNEALYDTTYGKAFLTGLINYPSCGNCQFKAFNNYSDITLGDAWGYENPEYKHKNSLVMLNTSNGKAIYNKIKAKLIEFDDFDTEKLLNSNYPILYPTNSHYNRNKIEKLSNNINNQLSYWQQEKNGLKKDKNGVGIINFHYENYNYGANLVAYSLSEAVKKLGFNPYIIDFDPFPEFNPLERYRTIEFLNFRKKYLNMTPKFSSKDELNILNDYLDMYITGSDQVWRKQITRSNMTTYFLDFAKNKNKVSYAASFGTDDFEGTEEELEECKCLLRTFYNISVREETGQKILSNKFTQDSSLVLDPTLLLKKEEYEKLITETYDEKIDVAVYFVMDHENIILNDKNFNRLFPKKKIVNIKGNPETLGTTTIFKYNSISKWLDGIRKCEYLVTDSYHGVILGTIFHKKIICIGKKSKALSRFKTLFKNLGGNLESINFSSLSSVKSPEIVINYEEIDKNIEKLKESSFDFLKDNIGSNKVKVDIDYEKLFLQNKILKEQIKELNIKYEDAIEEKNKILNSKSWRLTEILRKIKRIMRRCKSE